MGCSLRFGFKTYKPRSVDFQYRPSYSKPRVANLESGFFITQTYLSQKYSKFKKTLNNWLGLIRRNSTKTVSLLVSVLVLVVGLTLVRQQQKFVGKASVLGSCFAIQKEEFGKKPDPSQGKSEIEALNKRTLELSQNIEEFKKAPETKKKDIGPKLLALASLRKTSLVYAMRKEPEAALNSIFLGQEEIQTLLPNCLEKEETLEGTLEVFHADFFEAGVSDTVYTLNTQDGRKIQLHPTGNIHVGLESGTKVKVKGIIIDDEMAFDASQPIQDQNFRGGIDIISQPGNPPVIGEQKSIIILFNFLDDNSQPFTPSDMSQRIFGDSNSANFFYREASYNNIFLTGNVVGWYTVPINKTCNYSGQQREAIAAADPYVDFRLYSRIVLVNPYCGGAATIGKIFFSTQDGNITASVTWLRADFAIGSLPSLEHELGHNFGLYHANSLDCGTEIIGEPCISSRYGDLYDIMGNTSYPYKYFNSFHAEKLGWLLGSNIVQVTSSGSYSIEPLETVSSGVKTLKIQRSASEFLYLEYRQPIGLDKNIDSTPLHNITQGALLHTNLFSDDGDTQLLDATPQSLDPLIDFYDASLGSGRSISDPRTGTQINIVSRTASTLTVNVTLGQTDFEPPDVTVTSPLQGSTILGLVNVTANASDESGIERVEFFLYGPGTGFPGINFGLDTTSPFETYLNTTQVRNGWYNIYAYAYDVPGNVKSHAVGVWISNGITPTPTLTPPPTSTPTPTPSPTPTPVLTPTPTPSQDTILPTVSITSPLNGGTVPRNTTITIIASASDNVRVARVEFSVNGSLKCSDTTSPYACSWKVPAKPGVTYTLRARAYDLAGNTAFQNITVAAK